MTQSGIPGLYLMGFFLLWVTSISSIKGDLTANIF